MNELVISTYIQIMQDGLVEHNKQESAGRFILDSIAMQEAACVMTNLDAKKISRLVSRKDPVPEDIKNAPLKETVVDGVKKYFAEKVVPDLNPYTKADILEKIMNVIIQDVQIAEITKENFKKEYNKENKEKYDEFLVDTFLYSLQRDNKISRDIVEYQDIPLIAEVNYECPIKHVKLVKNIKGIPKKNYEITKIFPKGISEEMEAKFAAVHPKPADLDDPSNLIALSRDASENYSEKPTLDEYITLYNIKEIISKQCKVLDDVKNMMLDEEIRIVVDALDSLAESKELSKLEYEALRIDEKIKNVLLKNEVKNNVLLYYRYIESIFSESVNKFDIIATEVKLSSMKLEKAGLSQEEVISSLTDWIHNKAFVGGNKGKRACEIVVSFFVQNCEVFHK